MTGQPASHCAQVFTSVIRIYYLLQHPAGDIKGGYSPFFSLENEKQTKQLKNKAVTLQFSGSIGQISIHN